MARVMRGYAIAGLESVALWHERDISHSSAERVVLPDASATLDYMLAKSASLFDNLQVYPERMMANLNLTRGLVFSGQLLLALTNKGVSREQAYEWTQRNAMRVWEDASEKLTFAELVKNDADIKAHLSDEEINRVFSLDYYLRNVDAVFKRVFNESDKEETEHGRSQSQS